MKILIIISSFLVIISTKSIDKLPSSLKVCRYQDPVRDECIRDSIEYFLSSLHQKPDSIDFPSVEPFVYDTVTFKYNSPNFVQGWFTIQDQKNYGISRAKVINVKSDFTDEEMELQAIVNFPKLFTIGNYKSNISLGVFKIESKGQFNVSMYDVTAKWTIKGKLEQKEGEKYMNIYQFDVLPEAKNMKISASGLFPDQELNKFVNEFFNQHWKLFYQEMIPETRKQWEPLFRDICNKFFSQIPFKKLLLKN
ncbi:protein takeout-like [Chironomus tepperi]|uniref:protein takeout-like n=1 Tax=Chironomus tepperi TaxID=113505 RepID=UPI00391FA25E